VGVSVGVGVGVGVGDGVGVGVGVGDGVGVGEEVGVGGVVGDGVGVGEGVAVGVVVGDGVGVGEGVAVAGDSKLAMQVLLAFMVTLLSAQSGSPVQPKGGSAGEINTGLKPGSYSPAPVQGKLPIGGSAVGLPPDGGFAWRVRM